MPGGKDKLCGLAVLACGLPTVFLISPKAAKNNRGKRGERRKGRIPSNPTALTPTPKGLGVSPIFESEVLQNDYGS